MRILKLGLFFNDEGLGRNEGGYVGQGETNCVREGEVLGREYGEGWA